MNGRAFIAILVTAAIAATCFLWWARTDHIPITSENHQDLLDKPASPTSAEDRGASTKGSMELRHTAYSFILYSCRLGDRVRKGENPFTGESIEFPIDDGLNAADRAAVGRVFAKHGVKGPEPEGEGYVLKLSDNGSIRFRGGDLDDADDQGLPSLATEVVVEQLSDEVLNFLLEVARQGNLAFMSPTGDCVRLVQPSADPRVKKRWPDAAVIGTAGELRLWLEKDIGGRKVLVLPR